MHNKKLWIITVSVFFILLTFSLVKAGSVQSINFLSGGSITGNAYSGNSLTASTCTNCSSATNADTVDNLHQTDFLRVSPANSNPYNGNFAIGTDGTRNFIQSHSGRPLDINPLGNAVTINGSAPITAANIASQSVNYATSASSCTNAVNCTNWAGSGNYVAKSGDIMGGNLNFNNYGLGITGTYSATRYQAVFSMGDAYKLPADGTTTGNLYGLAWSHPNAGGIAGNLNSHGLLVLENGTFLAAISGSIRARDDVRAPIFYDSNDTNYYTDPNGTSRLSSLNVIGGVVGIGTVSPSTKAHIYGTLTVDPSGITNNYSEGIRIGGASNGYSIITFGANTASAIGSQANQWWVGRHGGDNGFNIFGVSAGDAFHILPSGNVGIGTVSPSSKLQVAGDISGGYILGSYFNSSAGNSENPTIGQIWTQSTGDNYLRKSTPAHFISQLGLIASGGSPTLGSISFSGVGGNSGQATPASDYRIYQAPGAWTAPYPDLNIAWHTGISIGAYYGYGGTRFFNNSDMVTELMSVGNGDNNIRVSNDLWVASAGRWMSNTAPASHSHDYATHRGEGTNYIDYSRYVYNNGAYSGSGWIEPSDLGVRYAGSAGNADTVDGQHFAWSNRNNNPTYLWAADSNGDSYLAWRAGMSVSYADNSGNASTANKVNGFSSSPDNSHPGTGLRPFYSWNTGQAGNAGAGYSNGITIGSNPTDQAYGFQIVQNMWDDRLYFRRYNGGWQSWLTVIDSATIGSQSVNYAASAGILSGPTHTNGSDGWFRSNGAAGWYSESYGVGVYATQAGRVDLYNGASLYVPGSVTAGSYIYSSDQSLKKNIATINNPLEKILQLRGVTFDWKADNKPGVGLIAQEVEKVFPELVSTKSDGLKGVQYGNLVAPLIEAVKAQQTQIQNQNDKIGSLQSNVDTLSNTLKGICQIQLATIKKDKNSPWKSICTAYLPGSIK